jgi:hypothetical protein
VIELCRRALRGAPFLVVTTALVLGACKSKRDADATPDELPGLAKMAEQGDATKSGRLQKEDPKPETSSPISAVAPEKSDDSPANDEPSKDGDKDASDGAKKSGHEKVDRGADEKSATKLSVKRIQFAEEISKREPVAAEETFSAAQTEKLYAFLEIDNPDKKRSHVLVTFVPPMGSPSKVELRVGDKSRWRTWALRRNVKAVGTWTVIVSDAKGDEIGRRTFEVAE